MAGVPGSSWAAFGGGERRAAPGFCARSVSTPGSTRTSRPSRSLRNCVGGASGRACCLSSSRNRYLTPSRQRIAQQRLTGFGTWNGRHRGVPQRLTGRRLTGRRLTGRRLTLSVVPRRPVVGTPGSWPSRKVRLASASRFLSDSDAARTSCCCSCSGAVVSFCGHRDDRFAAVDRSSDEVGSRPPQVLVLCTQTGSVVIGGAARQACDVRNLAPRPPADVSLAPASARAATCRAGPGSAPPRARARGV
jgi:hypothetical protein